MLVDAAASRAEEYLRGVGAQPGAGEAGDQDHRHVAAKDSTTCGWCPICAVAALVRGDRPELTSRLADQLAGLVELLRESLAEHRHADPAADAARPPAAEETKVQRIEVRRVRGRSAAAAQGTGHEPARDPAQDPGQGNVTATGERGC